MIWTTYLAGETRLLDEDGRELGRVWKFGPRHYRHSRLSIYDAGDTTLRASKAEMVYLAKSKFAGIA